ncbi:MAG: hypothetical protein U1D30_08730 [Planctomycetota bacterium]
MQRDSLGGIDELWPITGNHAMQGNSIGLRRLFQFLPWTFFCLWNMTPILRGAEPTLRVGSATVDFQADDSMVIGGGIGPGKAQGQEGKLRAVAVVLGDPMQRLAIVACDILMVERDILDAACRQIESKTGISTKNILINATHTHHAPTTCTVHGYEREEAFTRHVQECIVEAVIQADKVAKESAPCTFLFRLGEESSVGQNSRLLLGNNKIFWVGTREDVVRPTGPFDPELPVLAFRRPDEKYAAILFNHSTHTIGTREPGKRSPSFYGLAAQELEKELGTNVSFLEGASGSTHNITLTAKEAEYRIKSAVERALAQARPMPVSPLASRKREIEVRVRHFDELKEDDAVRSYCIERIPDKNGAESVIEVFRKMRRKLADRQGQVRKTWVQALRIGDVAIVGVPGEYFTRLGQEIKRQSPFRYTIVAELANDWVGYIPDREGYALGGYQVWTGLHSYVAPGTGELIVDTAVELLEELKKE